MLAGFGSAIAAGLAIWVITAMLMTTPQLPDAEPTIPGVTIAMEQEHTVRLVFASAEALESVFLDAGENGLFSLGEYETISALGLMEVITPEEIADAYLFLASDAAAFMTGLSFGS